MRNWRYDEEAGGEVQRTREREFREFRERGGEVPRRYEEEAGGQLTKLSRMDILSQATYSR